MSSSTERCSEKYGKKLIGRTDLEDALKRLDRLTQEEARMAIAQNLKATHTVDERVRGVANTVVAMDNRVAGVDDRVAGVDGRVARVDDRVAGVDESVKAVDDKVAEVIHGAQIGFNYEMLNSNDSDGREANLVVKQTAGDVDIVKRSSPPNFVSIDYRALHIILENQLRENVHKWLSPPDPSINHNIACSTHHKKTANWFFEGSIFREWKSTSSLLWIHGKRTPVPILT